jgi:hypothetical protein
MEEQELYGNLFNTIPLLSEDHLEIMLTTMDEKTALYYLTQAVKFAYQNGIYSLGECEIISKSIRLVHRPSEDNTETN